MLAHCIFESLQNLCLVTQVVSRLLHTLLLYMPYSDHTQIQTHGMRLQRLDFKSCLYPFPLWQLCDLTDESVLLLLSEVGSSNYATIGSLAWRYVCTTLIQHAIGWRDTHKATPNKFPVSCPGNGFLMQAGVIIINLLKRQGSRLQDIYTLTGTSVAICRRRDILSSPSSKMVHCRSVLEQQRSYM